MTEKQYDEEGRVIRENRSRAKREREHIKRFARELLKLPARQYPLLPVNETLAAALAEGKRLSGNALSRHLNYLTRLLDGHDFAAIRKAHEHVNHPCLQNSGQQQRIQSEIARLLAGDSRIYGELLCRYAGLDMQHLRQLVREARKQEAQAVDDALSAVNKYRQRLQKYLQGLALLC